MEAVLPALCWRARGRPADPSSLYPPIDRWLGRMEAPLGVRDWLGSGLQLQRAEVSAGYIFITLKLEISTLPIIHMQHCVVEAFIQAYLDDASLRRAKQIQNRPVDLEDWDKGQN
ncbi:unnamed protein product [Gadus morhua 'NCC']